jgi:hypothetical protein
LLCFLQGKVNLIIVQPDDLASWAAQQAKGLRGAGEILVFAGKAGW